MKLLGYCSTCGIMVDDGDIGHDCKKCSAPLTNENLRRFPPEAAARQDGRDLLKRSYKIQTKGIKNGGTTIKKVTA